MQATLTTLTLLVGITVIGTAIDPPSAVAQSTDSARFKSASGNINCALYEDPEGDYGNCLVKGNTWKVLPKRPADCDLDWEPAELAVVSEKRKATITNSTFVGSCRGDIGPLCEPGGCSTLGYGESITVGRITCTAQKAGITCVANQGRKRGFTIARASYKILS